jgi:hypothetical protein
MPLGRHSRISLGPVGLLVYFTIVLPLLATGWLAVLMVVGIVRLAVAGCRGASRAIAARSARRQAITWEAS